MSDNDKLAKTGEQKRFLEFRLGEEFFGIPLLEIREVIATPKTTPIPDAPKHFLGIMNLRGQVIPIINLAERLKIKPIEGDDEAAVIIIDVASLHVGITVDAVRRVLNAYEEELHEPPNLEQRKTIAIQKVFRNEEHMTLILNMAKTLDLEKIKQATSQAAA